MNIGVSNGEFRNYAKRLGVAFEPVRISVATQQFIQFFLRDVSEWRMPQVVRERGGFHYVGVNAAQSFRRVGLVRDGVLREPTRDLGDFQSVSQPVSKDDALVGGGDLGDAAKPAERGRVHNAVPVALSVGSRVRRPVAAVKAVSPVWRGHFNEAR